MKLLEVARQLDKLSFDEWWLLKICLDDRLCWLEEREPECGGMTYDNWDIKYGEWTEICELCEVIISGLDKNQDVDEDIEDLGTYIWDFHFAYGGLSRLKL